jgi:RNA polymerase sigma factor (sigma-70 family)
MDRATTRQATTLAHFYTTHREELINYASLRLGNREESKDLVQDVFAKMAALNTPIHQATIKSFAYTIADHKIKDVLRRRMFRRRMEEATAREMSLQSTPAERWVESRETAAIVGLCICRLSPACARVLRMSLFGGMPASDISRELNVSKRTVEAQLYISRKQMREMVKKAL